MQERDIGLKWQRLISTELTEKHFELICGEGSRRFEVLTHAILPGVPCQSASSQDMPQSSPCLTKSQILASSSPRYIGLMTLIDNLWTLMFLMTLIMRASNILRLISPYIRLHTRICQACRPTRTLFRLMMNSEQHLQHLSSPTR